MEGLGLGWQEELSLGASLRMSKLRRAHVFMDTYGQMNVARAVQLLSGATGRALQRLSARLPGDPMSETVKLIFRCNRVWDGTTTTFTPPVTK